MTILYIFAAVIILVAVVTIIAIALRKRAAVTHIPNPQWDPAYITLAKRVPDPIPRSYIVDGTTVAPKCSAPVKKEITPVPVRMEDGTPATWWPDPATMIALGTVLSVSIGDGPSVPVAEPESKPVEPSYTPSEPTFSTTDDDDRRKSLDIAPSYSPSYYDSGSSSYDSGGGSYDSSPSFSDSSSSCDSGSSFCD
jgi:hypothetical protein